jgi:hypothetical protein
MEDFKPPDGINFHCSEPMPIADLSSILCKIVSYLQSIDQYAKLRRYDDWWEHDGRHFYRNELDFHGLFEIVGNSRALFESMPGDEYVRIGIAPVDVRWYLRFYTNWDQSGSKFEGDFDITLPDERTVAFRDQLLHEIPHQLKKENARSYFQRIIL